MLGLPKSTEFNRRIPKQKFYENLIISPTFSSFTSMMEFIASERSCDTSFMFLPSSVSLLNFAHSGMNGSDLPRHNSRMVSNSFLGFR